MTTCFLYFLIYSFLGYLLEKAYAGAVRSPQQVRKCFLLLPLCPVYGLAMAPLAALTRSIESLPVLVILGAMICTGAEYLVHWFYDRFFGVQFWDYRHVPGNIRGRICPRFTVIWGILSAAAIRWLHPAAALLAARTPPVVAWLLWMLLAADCFLTAALLLQFRDTQLLTLPSAIAQVRASSQSSTSR